MTWCLQVGFCKSRIPILKHGRMSQQSVDAIRYKGATTRHQFRWAMNFNWETSQIQQFLQLLRNLPFIDAKKMSMAAKSRAPFSCRSVANFNTLSASRTGPNHSKYSTSSAWPALSWCKKNTLNWILIIVFICVLPHPTDQAIQEVDHLHKT